MNKEQIFNNEYQYIQNKAFLKDLKTLINLLPDYFFEIPASSSLKYHPEYALTNHGLVKHTKVAVQIARVLLNTKTFGDAFTQNEKDLIIIALILHDGLKSGIPKEKYTRVDHPLLIAKLIIDNKDKLNFTEEELNLLTSLISSHMGEWNKDYFTGECILPIPKTEKEKFVHLCDFLASKKFLEVEFDDINIKKLDR